MGMQRPDSASGAQNIALQNTLVKTDFQISARESAIRWCNSIMCMGADRQTEPRESSRSIFKSAIFGRFILRAFGVPTAARKQPGHATLAHWHPDGWQTKLDGNWGLGPRGKYSSMNCRRSWL